MPIIVATFTAVQKASAVHGNILVCDDPVRVQWFKRLLAQWSHGLSEIEPSRCANYLSETESACRDSSVSSVGRKPIDGHLLKSRELPVLLESCFARADAREVFAQAALVDTGVTFQPGGDGEDDNTDGILIERASFDVDALLESDGVRSSVLATPVRNLPARSPAGSVAVNQQMPGSICDAEAETAPALTSEQDSSARNVSNRIVSNLRIGEHGRPCKR